MKVLITGATGYVGREIVAELSGLQVEIIQVGGRNKPSEDSVNCCAENFFAADISDYRTLEVIEKIGRVDAVIHAAGLAHQFGETEREKFEAVNVRGTKNTIDLAVKLKARQFILIGSTAVYGIKKELEKSRAQPPEIEINENAECRPATFYAESKLEAEKAARDICEKNRVALTILRLAPVVGEGSAGNAARLIKAIDGGRFLWVGAGENYKTLIYKRDAARACSRVLLNKKAGTEIFNVAAAPVKMAGFVETIAKNLDRRILPIAIPARLVDSIFLLNRKFFRMKRINELEKTVEKWLSDDVYAARKIADAYGFVPRTSIETALERQVEAYKKEKEKINK